MKSHLYYDQLEISKKNLKSTQRGNIAPERQKKSIRPILYMCRGRIGSETIFLEKISFEEITPKIDF